MLLILSLPEKVYQEQCSKLTKAYQNYLHHDNDGESLHDFRVETRRLLALIPRKKQKNLYRRFKKIIECSNLLRDYEILHQNTKETLPCKTLAKLLPHLAVYDKLYHMHQSAFHCYLATIDFDFLISYMPVNNERTTQGNTGETIPSLEKIKGKLDTLKNKDLHKLSSDKLHKTRMK